MKIITIIEEGNEFIEGKLVFVSRSVPFQVGSKCLIFDELVEYVRNKQMTEDSCKKGEA